jgi:hypothetical protein
MKFKTKNLLKFALIILFILVIVFPINSFAQLPACDSSFSNVPCNQGGVSGATVFTKPGSSSGSSTAAQTCNNTGIAKLICQIQQILNTIVPVLVALGVVYFVWGVVRYVIADSEEAKTKGRDSMIYGIIGFAVIVGLWGFVNIIVSTFGLGGTAPALTPLTGAASTCSLANNPTFKDLLCYITGIINDSIIPLIFAVATVMFVWGVVQFFIINANEEKKREQGRQFMIWGIIALAVMLSVWGLVGIVGSTFGVGSSVLPQVHPPGASP